MFLSHSIVIDDFYPNPDKIHDLIYSMETEESPGGNYSGVMTEHAFFTEDHQMIFQKITGDKVKASTRLTGKIRFSLESDRGKQHIHFDPSQNCIWAGVCYLQKPEYYEPENSNGTVFWKHKRTGLSSIPMTQQGIEQHGWNNVDDLRSFLETDGVDESLWDKVLEVPYKYNRLVLFRPWMFHSPGKNFGTTKQNCRIIQTFFLSSNDT
jgi:hypothetical protein